MLLVVDIGNSFAKFGAFEDDELKFVERFQHHQIDEIETWIDKYHFTNSILSSVIDDQKIFAALKYRMPVLLMGSHLEFPIRIKYKTPQTLGHDRIAVAVAAHSMLPGNKKLIIDAGSCITYDFVDEQGIYYGGAISPGISMRFKALHNFTGKLPLVEQPSYDVFPLIGVDTQSSIISGIINGIRNEVNGLIDCYTNEYDNVDVFLTGGDIYYFDKTIKSLKFADENMVLFGLKIILEKNAKKNI